MKSPDTEWRPIPGHEGTYQISADGQVFSVPRIRPNGHRYGGIILKPSGKKYLQVSLAVLGVTPQIRGIHELVDAAFLGPRPEGSQIRHLDGDRRNNTVANLAYGTNGENQADAVRHGTHVNAAKTRCPQGHKYTPGNTYRASSGQRTCRTCNRAAAARYKARQKAALS